jgi:hypothetical protein
MPTTILSLIGGATSAPSQAANKGSATNATSANAIMLNNAFFFTCFSSFQNFLDCIRSAVIKSHI